MLVEIRSGACGLGFEETMITSSFLKTAPSPHTGNGECEGIMTTATAHRFIVRDDGILGGEPIVVNTRTPVRAVVELWRLGVVPEEIPSHLPHLTLAQVFDALSYYAAQPDEIQACMARNDTPDDLAHPASHANA